MHDWTALSEYFLIGDLHTAALVSRHGSIDWLCLPRFDSPSVFARVLDPDAGCLALDESDAQCTAEYVPDTAIVETAVTAGDKRFRLRDFMVPMPRHRCDSNLLVRKIINDGPETTVTLRVDARPEYGTRNSGFKRNDHRLTEELHGGQFNVHLPPDTEMRQRDGVWRLEVPLPRDGEVQFVLEFRRNGAAECQPQQDSEPVVRAFWEDWIGRGTYVEFCRDRLARSAITLKLMQYYPTGAIIAAPTTSLPERIGGVRNWDYRYVWIRDSTFTLYALHVLGYVEEAERFFHFLERTAFEGDGRFRGLHLMYTIDGREVPPEQKLEHLQGYRRSTPVRIGNGAAEQFQLDAYGSLIDAYYFMSKRNLALDEQGRQLIVDLVEQIRRHWHEPDHGIWEVRRDTEQFTYSKVMAWVGVDRALRLGDALNVDQQTQEKWRALSDEIRDWIWQHCYDQQRQVFLQHPDTSQQDASTLLFVLLQFLDKHEPRTAAIVDNTCAELAHAGGHDVFMYRYRSNDGLPGDEGAFFLCSFWMISAIAILEQVDRADELFQRLEQYLSHTGLISEEIDAESSEYLGNLPQAFSHMGYIMSAHYLAKYRARQQQHEQQASTKH